MVNDSSMSTVAAGFASCSWPVEWCGGIDLDLVQRQHIGALGALSASGKE